MNLALLVLSTLLAHPAATAPRPQEPDPEVPQETTRGGRVDEANQHARREEEYFAICDHDGDGWISFREASESLRVDRKGFAQFDTDQDGRITREEFGERYREIVATAGGFRPPQEPQERKLVPRRNPEQLRNAYDRDGDRALDLDELQGLLEDYDRGELPVDVVMDKLDSDGNGRLELGEMELMSRLLSITWEEASEDDSFELVPSVEALYGQAIPREDSFNAQPLPPFIPGPVPHFRRLDLDDDGFISTEDLVNLQRPVQLPIRAHAVVSALDTNADGVVDRRELRASMESKARP